MPAQIFPQFGDIRDPADMPHRFAPERGVG
jgi:hypothetical protein